MTSTGTDSAWRPFHFDPRHRTPVTLAGRLAWPGGAPMPVRIRNLSLRGAMIEHPHRLRPEGLCLLSLGLAAGAIHLGAEIVWRHASTVPRDPSPGPAPRLRSGLRFIEIPCPAPLHRLLATLAQFQAKAVLSPSSDPGEPVDVSESAARATVPGDKTVVTAEGLPLAPSLEPPAPANVPRGGNMPLPGGCGR